MRRNSESKVSQTESHATTVLPDFLCGICMLPGDLKKSL
jgi:hypothetical protein